MNVKISALPAATAIASTDVIPVVHGGVTQKVSREEYLTAVAGERIQIKGDYGNACNVYENGACSLVAGNGNGVILSTEDFTTQVIVNGTGLIQLSAALTCEMTCAGATIQINSDGSISILSSGFTEDVTITYVSPNPTYWATDPPIDVWSALHRLASAVHTLLGGAIP